MIDIKEQQSAIPENISDKQSDFEDATDDLLEEDMENLAYSESDPGSVGIKSPLLNDDDFKDALDQDPDANDDGNSAKFNLFPMRFS